MILCPNCASTCCRIRLPAAFSGALLDCEFAFSHHDFSSRALHSAAFLFCPSQLRKAHFPSCKRCAQFVFWFVQSLAYAYCKNGVCSIPWHLRRLRFASRPKSTILDRSADFCEVGHCTPLRLKFASLTFKKRIFCQFIGLVCGLQVPDIGLFAALRKVSLCHTCSAGRLSAALRFRENHHVDSKCCQACRGTLAHTGTLLSCCQFQVKDTPCLMGDFCLCPGSPADSQCAKCAGLCHTQCCSVFTLNCT